MKLLIRILAGLVSLAAALLATMFFIGAVTEDVKNWTDTILIFVFLGATACLFAIAAFGFYKKTFVSFVAWTAIILFLGHAFFVYDEKLYRYGSEIYSIFILTIIPLIIIGFIRYATKARQILIISISAIIITGYYFWFDNYTAAGKAAEKIDSRIKRIKTELTGNDCNPPLSEITHDMLDKQKQKWELINQEFSVYLPDSKTREEIASDIKNEISKHHAVISNLKVEASQEIEFYTETKFSFLINHNQASNKLFLDKFLNGNRLLYWQFWKTDDPDQTLVKGTTYGHLSYDYKPKRDYCYIYKHRVWLPPYSTRLDNKNEDFKILCQQALQHKEIIDRQSENRHLEGEVLSRVEITYALIRSLKKTELEHLKADLPSPCLLKR